MFDKPVLLIVGYNPHVLDEMIDRNEMRVKLNDLVRNHGDGRSEESKAEERRQERRNMGTVMQYSTVATSSACGEKLN
jgi:hypothetical protein